MATRLVMKDGYDTEDLAVFLDRAATLDPPEDGIYKEHPPLADRLANIRQIGRHNKPVNPIKNVSELNYIKKLLGTCKTR